MSLLRATWLPILSQFRLQRRDLPFRITDSQLGLAMSVLEPLVLIRNALIATGTIVRPISVSQSASIRNT